MTLFNKEKDIVHRFFNLILVVWFIIAVVILYSGCVDLIMKKPLPSYKRFQTINCIESSVGEESCERRYEKEKLAIKRKEFNNKKTIVLSLGNVVIVSAALYLINIKKK